MFQKKTLDYIKMYKQEKMKLNNFLMRMKSYIENVYLEFQQDFTEDPIYNDINNIL